MKLSRWALLAVAAPMLVAGCGSFSKAMSAHTNVVARAAGKELRVDEAATLLAANPQIPADPQVVRLLAEMWVDYTLLATAAAEDTTLAVIDLDKLIEPEREQRVIQRLLQQAIRPDTTFTDAELAAAWSREGPGSEVRARHILLRVPAEATPAQRDSVKKLAEALRARAQGGEDFGRLATQYSEDPGSKANGGDLGFFGRGRMVPAFDEAAFALAAGQLSPVVETPFGYHVIRVEERREQALGANREQFRGYMAGKAMQDAQTRFVDSLSNAAKVRVEPGATKVAKELAQQSNLSLRGRAAERTIVAYNGGEVTAGELANVIRTVPAQNRGGIADAPDEQIEATLKQLATRELLLAEAKRRNLTMSQASSDSLRSQARQAIREVVRLSGFGGRRIPKGAAGNEAIQAEVRALIQGVITGQRQAPPLGPLGIALQDAYGADVNDGAFTKVIEKMKAIRATQPAATPPVPGPGVPMPGQGVPQGQPQQAPPAPTAPKQ